MDERAASADLGRRAYKATLLFAVAVWLLVFVPAGSLAYWQGWLFWTQLTAWSVAGTWYFLKRNPALVERRLRAGPAAEHDPVQKRIQLFMAIALCAIFVVSGLDHGLGWSATSWPVAIAGNILVAAGYLLVFWVLAENPFASATIEVAAGQRVVSTGPYAVVRHPMYAGALPAFLGIPLALGSWWGLLPGAALAAGLVARLRDEEAYLARNLPGYEAYRATVRWRLVPGVW
jgi:protein-S-isoprenylcysteine O-methyltransferase Ste14